MGKRRYFSNPDVVEIVECDGCGCETPLKRNVHGHLYTWCTNIVEVDGKKEKCMTRQNFGRYASQQYLKKKEEKSHGKIKPAEAAARPEPKDGKREPEQGDKPELPGKPAERKRGILDKLGEFVTS